MHRSSPICRPLSLLLGLALLALPQLGGRARAADKFDKVNFDTIDGVTLQGNFYRGKSKDSPTVLLLHKIGSDSHKDGWDRLAEALYDKDYSVLSFDFRGHGTSINLADSMRFWDTRYSPWNNKYIKGGPLDAKGKLKETINHTGFFPGYLPYLVNDIAAAKMFLDERNDAGECNSRALILIGAEDGATLGALWMQAEWNRYPATLTPNLRGPRFPPVVDKVQKDPEGRWQYGALWLSMTTSLGGKISVSTSLKTALRHAGRDKKVPMGFLCGDMDATGTEHAREYVRVIKGEPEAEDKLPFTTFQAIKGTKLTGSGLLRKDLMTEEKILTYLTNLRAKNGPNRWSMTEAGKTAYVWTFPGTTIRIAKEKDAKIVEPIPILLLGINP